MTDPRVRPLVEVDVPAVVAAATGVGAATFEPIGGGLTNTLHRATTARGDAVAVKTFADAETRDLELELLAALAPSVPVPDVIGSHGNSIVYRWIDGVTLLDARRRGDDTMPFAAALGRTLAAIARSDRARPDRARAMDASQLASPIVRDRIGAGLASALGERLPAWLANAPSDAVLVHGDFGARNILVRDGAVVGILDWEAACSGAAAWDIGHLFRYPNRWSQAFRDAFAAAYTDAGGVLPASWWLASRCVDATGLIAVLADPRDLPSVFADCRDLLAQLVDDLARAHQ
jgi:aminoglycoside phosphotransferase (APT) family kinase protein